MRSRQDRGEESNQRKAWTRHNKGKQDKAGLDKKEGRKETHLVGKVVVNDDVDSLNVDTSAEKISGDENALVEFLKSARSKNIIL